jgi:hypothetical protein
MALVNQLSTPAKPFQHPLTAQAITGQFTKKIISLTTTTASDSNGSVYFLGQLPNNAVVTNINIHTADIASMSDCDIGIYDKDGNVQIGNYYADALDLSGHASGVGTSKYLGTFNHVAMSNVLPTAAGDPAWKNAGAVDVPYPPSGSSFKSAKYQIGLLANVGPTAAITFVAEIEYICAE